MSLLVFVLCILVVLVILWNRMLKHDSDFWQDQYWASQDYIDQLENMFKVGDKVEMPLEPPEKAPKGHQVVSLYLPSSPPVGEP
jgi:hypothetical protein